ncbi:MAG: hypothetical protein H7Y06_11645 [Opitutaceae bacterium]|nr:hypothetical protein [Opitutaceae bacterium]
MPSTPAALGQKIAELCCPAYAADAKTGFHDTGSFFVFTGDSASIRETIARASAVCSSPPVVTTDLEYGAGRMVRDATQFPSLFAAGRAGPRLAEEMGRVAAIEGRATGFHWTLAPGVDLMLDILNPTTSYRSAGRTTDEVIAIGLAYLRGLQAGGMLTTAKTFPGDGACRYDQHLTTAVNPLGMREWRETYGHIYATMIAAGVDSIMPGHISLPAYDTPDAANGQHPPATLSPRLMKDLLRGELGFDGLIVSDAVNMGGFCGFINYYDACARFLEAGGDVLLFASPTQAFLGEMLKRIDAGQLTEATLDDRLARFRRFKARAFAGDGAGVDKPRPYDASRGKGADEPRPYDEIRADDASCRGAPCARPPQLRGASALATADEIIAAGVQLLRDRKHWLPIVRPETKRILHVRLAVAHTGLHPVVDKFESALNDVFASVECIADPGPDRLRGIVENGDHDAVLVSVLNDYGYGVNHIHLAGPVARNMMGGWMHLGKPVVFISHAHPYLHSEYMAVMDCVVRTCGTVEATIPRLIDVIARTGAPIVADE